MAPHGAEEPARFMSVQGTGGHVVWIEHVRCTGVDYVSYIRAKMRTPVGRHPFFSHKIALRSHSSFAPTPFQPILDLARFVVDRVLALVLPATTTKPRALASVSLGPSTLLGMARHDPSLANGSLDLCHGLLGLAFGLGVGSLPPLLLISAVGLE